MSQQQNGRTVKIFRYDPEVGGEGHFDEYVLDIKNENTTTILDVLLRIQKEQDPTLAFRYACRVNMCGSCGMVINGREGLACKTNVSHIPKGWVITIRPLNHFPIIKDLVVDLGPFFNSFERLLPYYEPKMEYKEPAVILPDSRERMDIGMDTDCIWCGCCVSSCDMVHLKRDYAGPAPLTRAFTLLKDSRDGLFQERLERAVESCYHCRTEFNCTEVCPKQISGTRAIKYIQRMAAQHLSGKVPSHKRLPDPAEPAHIDCDAHNDQSEAQPQPCSCFKDHDDPLPAGMSRRNFLNFAIMGAVGVGTATVLGGLALQTFAAPSMIETEKRWVPLIKLGDLQENTIQTQMLSYIRKNGPYTTNTTVPVLISTLGPEIICFNSSCTHLGCIVKWDPVGDRFRCACHGGTFDKNGAVLDGPPPRPLDRFNTKMDGEYLMVEVV